MLFKSICAILVSCSLLGCGGDSSKTSSAQPIKVSFSSQLEGQTISCSTVFKDLGLSKASATLKDFRFYVSDIDLIARDGQAYPLALDENEWQTQNIALIDFQDKADECAGDSKPQRLYVSGTVPADIDFASIRFAVGLPSDLNHIDVTTAKGPLSIASLYWSWQSGYKFMRLDVAPVGGITRPSSPAFSASTFNFHLGSTNCTGEPESGEAVSCARSNRPVIELTGYSPLVNTIDLNYPALVAALDVGRDEADAPGCMSGSTDPECQAFFKSLGLDLSSGKPDANLRQSVFTVK